MKRVLLVFEPEKSSEAKELVGLVNKYFPHYELHAVIDSHNLESFIGLVNELYVVEKKIDKFNLQGWSQVVTDIAGLFHFDLLLVAATYWGRMLAPRVAAGLDIGLVADVTDLEVDGEIAMIRPAYSGQLFAKIVKQHCDTTMFTVRPGAFEEAVDQQLPTKINYCQEEILPSSIELLSVVDQGTVTDITEAKLLVAGGAGSEGYFNELKSFAKLLDGSAAASRKIVDAGLMSRTYQVGHSGHLVKPSLYIAIGIYGAVQHIEGIKRAQNVLSVNLDPQAPINSLSRWVVVGDGLEFIRVFTDIIEKYRKDA